MIKKLLGLSILSGKTFDVALKVGYVIVAIIGFSSINNLMKSGIEGDITLFERDPKTGRVYIGRIQGKKTLPPNLALNMLSIHFDHNLDRTVDFKRHVLSIGDFHFYAGGGLRQVQYRGDMDTRYHVGVTVVF